MIKESKKIKEEFGFESEVQAVKEYGFLNRDFMYFNYPLIAGQVISGLNLEKKLILDVGTGLGSLAFEFAKRLPRAYVYGLDISQEMLREAEKAALDNNISNLKFTLGDVHSLEFEDNFFDLVVSFGVLHHLKDVKLAFSEIKRVLKEGGCAFIYDLRKEAAQDTVSEIASQMPLSHKQAFLESIRESLGGSFIDSILKDLNVSDYSLSQPRYSRQNIIQNKELLKKSKLLGKRFNEILIQIYFRK